ncbi:MAG: transposase [candidate division WOR-3 bacterium]
MAQLFTLARIKQIEIAIDGTHLCAQPHDPEAQWGFKRQTFSFFGYKVILLVSVKEPIFPIAVAVVPGNQSESPQFHKVIDQLQAHHPTIKVTKVFGDAGFDANENFEKVLKDLEAKPYIAINTRGKENPSLNQNLYLDKEGYLCCLSGRRLVYWGEERRRRRVKYRCPIAVSGGDCLFAPLCNRGKYGRSFYIGDDSNYRLQGIVVSSRKSWKEEYAKKRARIEAENGILKNNRGMKNFYFRRLVKVRLFVLLCCLGEVGRRIAQVKVVRDLRRLRKSA